MGKLAGRRPAGVKSSFAEAQETRHQDLRARLGPGQEGVRLDAGNAVIRRSGALAAALAFALALALAAFAPDSSAAKRFRGYGSCNVLEKRPDSDSKCVQGDPWGAVFVAKRQSRVKYKLCVRGPGGGKDCFKKRTKKRGKPSVVGFFGPTAPHTIGKYRFVWKVGGRFAAKDTLRIGPEI